MTFLKRTLLNVYWIRHWDKSTGVNVRLGSCFPIKIIMDRAKWKSIKGWRQGLCCIMSDFNLRWWSSHVDYADNQSSLSTAKITPCSCECQSYALLCDVTCDYISQTATLPGRIVVMGSPALFKYLLTRLPLKRGRGVLFRFMLACWKTLPYCESKAEPNPNHNLNHNPNHKLNHKHNPRNKLEECGTADAQNR